MKKLHTRRGGFTLIELMIVVAIIGILAAIAIPNFLRFQLKAKSSEGKTNLAAIRTAEESYFAEYGNYISALPVASDGQHDAVQPEDHLLARGRGPRASTSSAGAPRARSTSTTRWRSTPTSDEFTAGAGADIDNDTATGGPRRSGATTRAAVDAKDHGRSGSAPSAGIEMPRPSKACDTVSGNSVF